MLPAHTIRLQGDRGDRTLEFFSLRSSGPPLSHRHVPTGWRARGWQGWHPERSMLPRESDECVVCAEAKLPALACAASRAGPILPARGNADEGGVGVEVGAQGRLVEGRVAQLELWCYVGEAILAEDGQVLVDLDRHT